MDTLQIAFSNVFQIEILLMLLMGVLFGILVGSLPGLTATMAVAIISSFTFSMDTIGAILLLIGVYFGAVYGGSIAAILLHIPGTPAAIMSAIEGYEFTKKGHAGKAIGISVISSVFGGLFSIIVLILAAPIITGFALGFGSPEYLTLGIFGLGIVASVTGDSLVKGLIATFIGLFIATIGVDPITGQERFTFGVTEFRSGLSFVPMMIGLFGITEILKQLTENEQGGMKKVKQKIGKIFPDKKTIKNITGTLFRSSIIGTAIGTLPGMGASISSFVAYNDVKTRSKNSESFGKGESSGLAAPESANNASAGGALMPMLTLGIPGDAVTAILIGTFMIHGLQPGPLLFENDIDLVYSIYIGAIIALIFLLFIGIWGANYFARLISINPKVLFPTVILFCVVGSFAISNIYLDTLVMFAFGIIGYIFYRLEIPISPIILGIVLGPIIETNLRSALIQYDNITDIVSRPIVLLFLILTFLSVILPQIKRKWLSKNEPNP